VLGLAGHLERGHAAATNSAAVAGAQRGLQLDIITLKVHEESAPCPFRRPYHAGVMSTPSSSPSPAPGWTPASDGHSYPQKWENTFIYQTNESLKDLIEEVSLLTKTHGEQGWELVSSSVQRTQVTHRFSGFDKAGELLFEWSIVCSMKRPLSPE
jgi:hypothetical protein